MKRKYKRYRKRKYNCYIKRKEKKPTALLIANLVIKALTAITALILAIKG